MTTNAFLLNAVTRVHSKLLNGEPVEALKLAQATLEKCLPSKSIQDIRHKVRYHQPGKKLRLGKNEKEICRESWERSLEFYLPQDFTDGKIPRTLDEGALFMGIPIEWTDDESCFELI